jgi:hypothetical protein
MVDIACNQLADKNVTRYIFLSVSRLIVVGRPITLVGGAASSLARSSMIPGESG